MNAAFLLVTTAWIAGADAAAPPAAPAPSQPAVVHHAAPPASPCNGGSCGSSCDSCCESEGLLTRLRNKFRRDDCGCERESLFSRLRNRFNKSDCCEPSGSCSSSCDACCEESFGSKLRGRLRGLFRRGDCCESSCDSCGSNCCDSAPAVIGAPVAPRGEPIPAPKESEQKKMPAGDKGKVKLIPQNSAPILEIAPTSTRSRF